MLQLLKRLGWGLEEGGVTFRGGEVWFFSFQVFFESRVKNRDKGEEHGLKLWYLSCVWDCGAAAHGVSRGAVLETRLDGDLTMELSALIA